MLSILRKMKKTYDRIDIKLSITNNLIREIVDNYPLPNSYLISTKNARVPIITNDLDKNTNQT